MANSVSYEIRANLLHLAQRIVSETTNIKNSKSSATSPDSEYTVEQVVETAKKLNEFVSNG